MAKIFFFSFLTLYTYTHLSYVLCEAFSLFKRDGGISKIPTSGAMYFSHCICRNIAGWWWRWSLVIIVVEGGWRYSTKEIWFFSQRLCKRFCKDTDCIVHESRICLQKIKIPSLLVELKNDYILLWVMHMGSKHILKLFDYWSSMSTRRIWWFLSSAIRFTTFIFLSSRLIFSALFRKR